ncbi:HAD family hydrolase [Brachybacterium sp. AOP25-B2-12]|uniref:HAD family hydrolase n=1 Tax=Brachybacterium sp. AOP25-B2-12 TaxID=3457710 RepID=UPI0040333BFA
MRGVLFDIDHTLVDTAAAFEAALGASLLPLLPPDADPIALALQWGHDAGGWYRAYTRGELGYLAQRRRRMDEVLLDHGGAALDDAGFARATELFDRAFAASWRPFPDAVEIVARLAAAGVPLGAVSNAGGAMQRCKLAAVGFATLVPLLVTMDTFGVGKPDPRVFVEGARLLGVQPDEVAYVGDEPDIDADAATRAGLVGVHLRRAGDLRFGSCPSDQREHLEVGDLTALTDVLALPCPGGTR